MPSRSVLDPPSRLQCLLCREIFRKRHAPADRTADWTVATDPLRRDGIAELVRIAESTVEDERQRGRQLDTKTASLAGFSGLILSIDTALARSVFGVDLGPVGDIVARVGFAASAVALLVAVALAVAGVLMPQKYRGLGREEIDDFSGPGYQAKDPMEIHRALIPALVLMLAQDRSVNDCKARLTKGVARALLAGFVGLAAAAVTLAEHATFGTMTEKKTPSSAQVSPPPPPPPPMRTDTSERGK